MQGIIPPHLLEKLATHPNPAVAMPALRSIATSTQQRTQRAMAQPSRRPPNASAMPLQRRIYSAAGFTQLPGFLRRIEGELPVPDPTVNAAYDGSGIVWEFWRVIDLNSFDGHGAMLVTTCHYGSGYDNAMWNGSEIVGGDGDGVVFNPFFSVPDIIWHEWGHAVTQYASNLYYDGESGGLNESFSDCHGMTVLQWHKQQSPEEADWIVGKGIFAAGINGAGLRSMKSPGTAYDDPQLGHDPQIANYADYFQGMEVHMSSGIANKAFCLACLADGSKSWEKMLPIWHEANRRASGHCTFKQWAKLTVDIAVEMGWPQTAGHIADAWAEVGVGVSAPLFPAPAPEPEAKPLSMSLAGFGTADGKYKLTRES